METFSQAGADYFATSGCSYPHPYAKGLSPFTGGETSKVSRG
jgi:hypothetical protein